MVFTMSSAAYAENSFSSVPKGHWAYDAISQLASRGFLDMSKENFDGSKTVSRFEIASLVSKAYEKMKETHASEYETQLVKRLCAEFHTELEAIGAKMEAIDKRLSKVENGIGGWNISGSYYMDMNFAGGDEIYFTRYGQKYDINHNRLRFYLDKRINEDTTFHSELRMGAEGANYPYDDGYGSLKSMTVAEFYVDTVLPGDINLRVGRFTVDNEDEYGFYMDDDATFGDYRMDGFKLEKQLGHFKPSISIGRNAKADGYAQEDTDSTHYHSIFGLHYEPNERFFAGSMLYWYKAGQMSDEAVSDYGDDWDVRTFWLYAKYNITPDIALRGMFYQQNMGSSLAKDCMTEGRVWDSNPRAWNAILEIGQETLKFTSLWLEFCRQDNNFCAPYHDHYTIFGGYCDRYVIGGSDDSFDGAGWNLMPNNGSTNWVFVRTEQEWTKKFSTFERFVYADLDTPGYSRGIELCVGMRYKLNDAITFQLLYSRVDHGENDTTLYPNDDIRDGVNHVVRLRTEVTF